MLVASFFLVKNLFIVYFIDVHASIKKRQTYVCKIVEIKTASISRFVTQSLRKKTFFVCVFVCDLGSFSSPTWVVSGTLVATLL